MSTAADIDNGTGTGTVWETSVGDAPVCVHAAA